ncbi:phage GP46 family protein [Laribacter hongkongensis]|uniref:phage GP46 family protein n=1 Tax=Laribacter hongkongensis TaxID=168471 RepID=UPI001EFE0B3F|nr:phage GP46 family protein [Laribacter hongkongensis]MCG8993206.1 phage GP46 family protein [Laribacter hongkongensis]MCG8997975.1 phage GP46 family protein [Laribacter hongkongensis]MCG9002314.1 phage GP46 family protein [Laribacter hongkongensis]MCG9005624.1 phage GP46 family protein [Laribacter hongkongensis]MCG9008761.1 phage GP46 family protein [Laribacter hongkongensis]
MDALLDPQTGDYAGSRTDTLTNAVYLRLTTPLGSWWAEPTLGSRLHELQREKDVSRIAVLARQYAEQALAPLLKDGRADRITVTTSRQQPGWLQLHIQVEDASGRVQHFQHPVKVA